MARGRLEAQRSTHGNDRPCEGALDPCGALDEGEERLARSILDHIADKWSIWVIYDLGRGG
jgi:hypothetical protein